MEAAIIDVMMCVLKDRVLSLVVYLIGVRGVRPPAYAYLPR